MEMKRMFSYVLVVMLGIALMAGCSKEASPVGEAGQEASPEKAVRLATMTDEEGRIIGAMMQLMLEANGFKVDSKVGTFNNTTLIRQSIEQNQADMSLDYTGRGMMFIKDVDVTKFQTDLETAFNTTKEADESNGIIWLTYAPFNNTDGIAVRKDWAEEHKVHNFEEFAKYVNDGGEMKLAINGPNSYAATAETCLPGWEKAYGFKLKPEQVVVGVQDAQSMAANNTDGIIATHVYTTSGVLEALNLVVIEDPKVISPVYSPAPIASKAFMEKYPEVQGIMEKLFDSLDGDSMRHLNTQVSVEGLSEKDVAKKYLEEKNLIP